MSDEENKEEPLEITEGEKINDKYVIVRQIARGAFGEVYHVVSLVNDFQGAMKVEPLNAEEHVLRIEVEVLNAFRDLSPGSFMRAIDFSFTQFPDKTNFSFIVMPLCGPDLDRLHGLVGSVFSEGTLLRIALRMMLSLKELHEIGYIHRDIKPCNFASSAFGTIDVHLIDFGMARQYAIKKGSKWELRKMRTKVFFRGTLRYASLNAHKRIDQARVDDLWSWYYMCVEFRRQLPWSKLKHPEQVAASKEKMTDEKIHGNDPVLAHFGPISGHLRKLEFYDRPDYKFLAQVLEKRIRDVNCPILSPYDWDGKISNVKEVQEKVEKVCAQHNIKCSAGQVKVRTEEEEWVFLKEEASTRPGDVPGGKDYVRKSMKSDRACKKSSRDKLATMRGKLSNPPELQKNGEEKKAGQKNPGFRCSEKQKEAAKESAKEKIGAKCSGTPDKKVETDRSHVREGKEGQPSNKSKNRSKVRCKDRENATQKTEVSDRRKAVRDADTAKNNGRDGCPTTDQVKTVTHSKEVIQNEKKGTSLYLPVTTGKDRKKNNEKMDKG